eukprot:1048571-Amphidinium_carterae.2
MTGVTPVHAYSAALRAAVCCKCCCGRQSLGTWVTRTSRNMSAPIKSTMCTLSLHGPPALMRGRGGLTGWRCVHKILLIVHCWRWRQRRRRAFSLPEHCLSVELLHKLWVHNLLHLSVEACSTREGCDVISEHVASSSVEVFAAQKACAPCGSKLWEHRAKETS